MLGSQMVPYQMSQGKKKIRVIFCSLQNPVQRPGCLTPLRRAAAAEFTGCLSTGPSSVKHCTVDVAQTGLGTALLQTLIEAHFCLTCMVGGRERGSHSKIFIPKWVSDI